VAIAALDLGRRRIGIALCEDDGAAVVPLDALERRGGQMDLSAIMRRLGNLGVTKIIVGLPLNMDGSAGPAARAAQDFAARLSEFSGLPVETCDERLSSIEAEERLRELPGRRGRAKAKVDALAATIILERWLGERRR
jgi:putative Holliday junction resolvase